MAVVRSTWTDDDGSGSVGTIINNAELQKIYDNIDNGQPWTDVTFNVANFIAVGGTWVPTAGEVSTNRYCLPAAKTLHWELTVLDSPTTGTNTELRVTLPTGICAKDVRNITPNQDNNIFGSGVVLTSLGNTYLRCFQTPSATVAWTASLHEGVQFDLEISLQ